jgi:hypothetical protein
MVPDVLTLRGREQGAPLEADIPGAERESGSSPAIAEAPAGVLIQELAPPDAYAARARRIAIKDGGRGDEVVAVIEPVSRGNKSSRRDRDQFVEKATSLLRDGVHLLIIDLQHPTTTVPDGFHALVCAAYGEAPAGRPVGRALEAVSYEALDSGAVRSRVAPLTGGDILPDMPVFLRPGRYVRVPLERTYAEAFQGLPAQFRRVLEARP